MWSKDGAINGTARCISGTLWQESYALLELLLGLHRSPESPGATQEELHGYRIIRFGRELKLSGSVVARLGSTEPKSSTEGWGRAGQVGAGSVEASGGVEPCK